MNELKEIVNAYHAACREGLKTALATVVHVEGSAYRQAGARMLVTENGALTGAISGGCLEGDALRKAQLVILQQQPILVTYDTTDEDDAKLGVGLGCNGIIHILLEPLPAYHPLHPVALLEQLVTKRQSAVLVTLFSLHNRKAVQPGTCLLLTGNGQLRHSITNNALQTAVIDHAQQAMQSQRSLVTTYVSAQENITALAAWLPPVPHLLIAGAGNDAMPLVKMAHLLGWHTTVVDGRPAYATKARFPEATQVVAAKPEQVLSRITADAYTAVVLMTHNYNYDLALLTALLPLSLPYTGILGPAKKRRRMLAELKDMGIHLTDMQRERLYGPAGLDIGAETTEEIALSIISEIKTVLSAAAGISLREKKTAIHSRAQQVITKQQL